MPKKLSNFRSVPVAFLIPAVAGILLVVGPLLGLLLKTPWNQIAELMTNDEAQASGWLSIKTALVSTLLCAVMGVPLALVFSKVLDRIKSLRVLSLSLYALMYTPVILSPVVSGLALTFFWGRKGTVGQWLYQVDITIPFTTVAVIITQVFVGLPFFLATAVTTLRAIPREYEEIAYVEGATAWEVTSKVLLPVAAPGLATAFLLSFARALGEYGATVTFAGNIAEKTRTIPLNIELMLSSNHMNEALGSALQLLSLYLIVLGISLAAWNIQRLRRR